MLDHMHSLISTVIFMLARSLLLRAISKSPRDGEKLGLFFFSHVGSVVNLRLRAALMERRLHCASQSHCASLHSTAGHKPAEPVLTYSTGGGMPQYGGTFKKKKKYHCIHSSQNSSAACLVHFECCSYLMNIWIYLPKVVFI